MKFSKVIYFLLIGTILATIALLVVFDQSDTEDKKEVIVPLVKEVVDAKPIEIKPTRKQEAETIKLEVIRVRPDGSLVIAGKSLPNSKVEIISGSKVIAVTTSDKIGDFVAVPQKQLEIGEYFLSFRQTTKDKKVIIANKSVAINVTGAKNDTPIVAIIDSEGKLGAKVIQAPGLDDNKEISKEEKNIIEDQRDPYIAILAITHDTMVGQLVLSGRAHNGVQINAGFTGKETSSTKIINDEWTLSIPGKLIAGKQKIFAVLLGKNGKVLSENSIIISGKIIQNANGKTFVVVQKGDALWNIAYQRLGVGNRYIDIVKLNKNKIINPDLIYPKQLFIIPKQVMD
ncbi:MAG: LysM peptidoglycan-binding domain-containing protein [Candidatus Puniceispirillales bacterium]